jgi:hypothetical protein
LKILNAEWSGLNSKYLAIVCSDYSIWIWEKERRSVINKIMGDFKGLTIGVFGEIYSFTE